LKVGKFRKSTLDCSRADGTMEENAAPLYGKVMGTLECKCNALIVLSYVVQSKCHAKSTLV
jgi:hypothetical protein